MKLLFLDESGSHNLAVVDPQYPVFVLGGVILEQTYLEEVVEPELAAFKRELFGSENLVIHTADLTRNRGGFEGLKAPSFRGRFYRELNNLMSRLEYQVVACVVRKEEHLRRYGVSALDPYVLSLGAVLEQFCFEIGEGEGPVVLEARGHPLDRQLELAWENLKVQGTEHLRGAELARRISSFELHDKAENLAGLQLADLVVTPIGRHVLGKRTQEDFRIIQKKFRRVGDTYDGAGLMVLPQKRGSKQA